MESEFTNISLRDSYNESYLLFKKKSYKGYSELTNSLLHNRNQQNVKKKLQRKLDKIQLQINQPPADLSIHKDQIVLTLAEIEKFAKRKQLFEIQKSANLLLGRRLMRLQIDRRYAQYQKKKQKKQDMEEQFFWQKRMKKFDYQKLKQQKLKQNSFITKPYDTGKGFIQSNFYSQYGAMYTDRLKQCQYVQVIKQVNRIFMNNFSYGSAQSGKQQKLTKLILFCVIFTIVLCLSNATFARLYLDQPIVTDVYLILYTVCLLILFIVGLVRFLEKPKDRNQIEQTLVEVRQYFNQINKEHQKNGKNHRWICPQDFMYLQVQFNEKD